VRTYGHYITFEGGKTSYWRHEVCNEVNLTSGKEEDRWFSYKFSKNIYEVWVPEHLKRLKYALARI
jgi:hypothetical protein